MKLKTKKAVIGFFAVAVLTLNIWPLLADAVDCRTNCPICLEKYVMNTVNCDGGGIGYECQGTQSTQDHCCFTDEIPCAIPDPIG